ncbi:MAG TPA: AraC family transcriptional regulator, partial [Gemmatimonadaceae bacterium]|nr:AraC family transcriptional regulator [Gemmatimonadaceae bacterium]
SPQLAAAVQLILAESVAPGPGSSLVSARLAEILLVHALRAQAATKEEHASGLCALADPMIGASLRLMHAQPAEQWTVERLAREVGMSRSAFAARFTQLVGEAPLQYLTRWRMTQAAEMLREREDSVPAIAERVGYGNATAFTKAFSRIEGVGPGAYRRRWRVRAAAST